MYVPFGSRVLHVPRFLDWRRPSLKYASENSPSRKLRTSKNSERALTALVPTPFMPAENWKLSESNLPPVFICETQSTTFSSGMPRP